MDMFHEEVVIKRNQSSQNLLYVLALIMLVISAGYALFMFNVLIMVITSQGFSTALLPDLIVVALAIGAAVMLFLFRDRIKMEYEYTFTNGIIDFAQVFNNKKRKNLGSMNVRNVEAFGEVASGSFKRYSGMQGIKLINWFLNRDAKLYYFYFVKDNSRKMIIIEPSDTLVDMIKRTVGAGKFQAN